MSDKPESFKVGETTQTLHRSGFYFDSRTPEALRDTIARVHRSGARVRVFYGDRETGEAWAEESDVLGTLGASTGPCRVPLLIGHPSDMCGGSLLDSCIVAIRSTSTREWLYKHPAFNVGAWHAVPSDLPEYASAAMHNGAIHARFKHPRGAARYVEFMKGERFAK